MQIKLSMVFFLSFSLAIAKALLNLKVVYYGFFLKKWRKISN